MKRLRIPRLGPRATSGSAAIEFALIAPMLLVLLLGIFEVALAFFADVILQNGVVDAARLIRTGQAAAQNMTQAQFLTTICGRINYFLTCDPSKLTVDVRAFSSFGTAGYPPAMIGGNLNPALGVYQPGNSSLNSNVNTIILVRAFYKWQLLTPMVSSYFGNMGDQSRLLAGSVAFRNEPY